MNLELIVALLIIAAFPVMLSFGVYEIVPLLILFLYASIIIIIELYKFVRDIEWKKVKK